jgi:hypothetical protein
MTSSPVLNTFGHLNRLKAASKSCNKRRRSNRKDIDGWTGYRHEQFPEGQSSVGDGHIAAYRF